MCNHPAAVARRLCKGSKGLQGSPQASKGSGEAECPTSAHIRDIHHKMVKASGFGLPFSSKASSWSSCSAKVWRLKAFIPCDTCQCPDLVRAKGELRQKVSWEHSHTPAHLGAWVVLEKLLSFSLIRQNNLFPCLCTSITSCVNGFVCLFCSFIAGHFCN